jgi:hypothetical protein
MFMKVNEWEQAGHLYLWRYPARRLTYAGWHVAADGEGCASLVDLLDRMEADAVDSHRTIALDSPSAEISGVPNFGKPVREKPGILRIVYERSFPDFFSARADEHFIVRIGEQRLPDLRSAFVEISIGGGDFTLWPDDEKIGMPMWFWWMPRQGKHRF